MGISQEKIDRINALARKSKAEPLTAEEKDEQAALRQEYVAAVRASLRGQLDSTYVVDPKTGEKLGVREANRKAHQQGKPGVKIKLK
ncbi:MAG: DUF896 domain-containing protein [Clostridiales bacterium]|nr:DUF896 domain-containing protein [Clostridiales bacterium]